MLRLLHDRLGRGAVYGSALARYFMVAFDLPLRAVSPLGGWAPDGMGAVSDVRIQELLYPEIIHRKQVWSPGPEDGAALAESAQLAPSYRGATVTPYQVRIMGFNHARRTLEARGWHIEPVGRGTTRLRCISSDGTATRVQVRSLRKPDEHLPVGNSLEELYGNFWIIVTDATAEHPTTFVLRVDEVKALAHRAGQYWIDYPHYVRQEWRERWDRIGKP
jgi:hypothetical protein